MAGERVTIPRLEDAARKIDELQSSAWLGKLSKSDKKFVDNHIVSARDAINDVLELMRDNCDLELLIQREK